MHNPTRTNYGSLWPIMILSCLALVLILALGMLFFGASFPAAASGDAVHALSVHSESIAQQLMPSVVRVFVQKRDASQTASDLAIYFGDSLALPREDLGSGMFIDNAGHVLTNYHVVHNASSIEVADHSGRRVPAVVVGTDSLTDLAVIETSLTETKPIVWEESSHIRAGAFVWAFGSPFGLDNSVTLGIISSSRNSTISDSPFQDFLQTDVALNPGSSGGPLVNADAKVVGVNTAIAGDRFQGVSFAIPNALARDVADQLTRTGTIERGWLGVELSAVDPERARQAGLSEVRGVYVQAVRPVSSADVNETPQATDIHDKSSADENRLQAGDICLQIEGKDVNDPVQFSRTVAATSVGRALKLLVRRDGRDLVVTTHVAPRPKD